MKYFTRIVFFSLVGVLFFAGSCEKEEPVVISDQNPYYPVMFYNVENLFDTLDQPGTFDEEFMPDAEKEWNGQKLFDKLDKIARVAGDADTIGYPAIIGLCEVENRSVLELLLQTTALKDQGYRIIHKESPDYRGIDVALLYKEDLFELEDYRLWQVWFPYDIDYRTREVLYVKGNLNELGTIHFFVNHWPSRSGGEIETRPKRIFVAEMVRSKVDSVLAVDAEARIVIMGDMNDEPNDLSIISGLSARDDFEKAEPEELYAISRELMNTSSVGSYKYQGNWNFLDQFVVSGELLDTSQTVYCRPADVQIVNQPYLFEEDKTYMGKKPFRTYLGDYYHGGYSDHLPVILRLRYRD